VYTGHRGPSWALTLATLAACLSWSVPAQAEDAWPLVTLPGGRATLLPSLGLAADLPRAMVVGEIIRTVYPARDARGRLHVALTTYFAAPPNDGDETVPLPMPLEFWQKHVVGRAVPERELLGAILSDRRASLICYGLLGVDAETRAFILATPSIVAAMTERDASGFASFANIVRVRNGALDLPGGPDAAAVWANLLGTSPQKPADAIHALVVGDYGRLPLFVEAIDELDPAHRALAISPGEADQARIARLRSLYRSFIAVDYSRNLEDLTFQRVPLGPAVMLAALPPGQNQTVEGPEDYWRALMANVTVPASAADEWGEFDMSVPATPGFVLDRFAQEALPGRRELISTVYFVERLVARFPQASLADRVFFGHAFRRYEGLLLTLERVGVDDLEVWRALVEQARALDARASIDVDVLSVLLQAPLAIIDRAVQVRTLDPHTATTLLAGFARIDPGAPRPARAVGRFLLDELLPAMTAAALEDGGRETSLLHGLAGLSPSALRATSPQKVVRWEDLDYRVDPAAAEAARLREVRNRQGGNTLDTALAIVRAELLLSASPSADNRRLATRLLRDALTSLEGMEEDEPTSLRTVDVVKIVEQAAGDAGKSGDPHTGAIADRLARVSETVLADTLSSIVYALWIGDPDGQPFLGGNVAHRHDFGRRNAGDEERERVRWMVPEETYTVGEPWHLRGSLLALDIGLGRLALRRTTSDLPQSQPRINDADRRAFITSLVLMPVAGVDQASADLLVQWVAAGAAMAGAVTPSTLGAIEDRLRLDERRRAAVLWTAEHDAPNLSRLFLLSELVALGRPPELAMPKGWGPSEIQRTGCYCLGFADPPAPQRPSLHSATSTVASVIADLQLKVLSETAALHLPASLVRGIHAAALQDYLDNARPAYIGDWWTLGELARTLSRERVLDYVSALTAGGPLVPASERATDGNQ
jgi:hypothetical protein